MNSVYSVWKENLSGTPDEQVLDKMTGDEIADAFLGNISFGTGGLRGVMGLGTNRLNQYTIERVTHGLAKTILSSDAPKSVGVAFDTRHNSAEFAAQVGETLAAFGLEVYTFDSPVPTPLLSYAIKSLGLGWGVVLTASHNPQEYNGYKVYDRHGVQLTDKMAEEVTQSINTVKFFEPIPENQKALVKIIGTETIEAYLEQVTSFVGSDEGCEQLKIVYSALHGAGASLVPAVLERLGFSPAYVQLSPDGAFGGLKTPNPEEPVVYEKALAEAKKSGADILLATDPDCDRVGVMVKTKKGFEQITGNQVGALLIDYLAIKRGVSEGDTVISTIVSGTLGEALAESYGLDFVRLLTGFKYIGEYIVNLQKGKHFFFGYEESYGYLAGDGAKDKDAVLASALIAKMAAFYHKKGMTLIDRWLELSEKHGYHLEHLHSARATQEKQREIMKRLREKTPIGGVSRVDDYSAGVNNLPPADVIKLHFENGSWAAIRPSGTEPKIKLYAGVRAKTHKEAEKALKELTDKLLSELRI